MEKIALPQKIKFEKGENENQEIVTIEPCFPGYGITLGNSIRRVLLSSLTGAAVVGVKIKGADHEFMTLSHVKEDVLQIILSLKKLRLKVHAEGVVTITLDAHGEKEVTANDFTPNSQVEIMNKDLSIAHITDMAGNLQLEVFVASGRGYETIESRESEKHELGYIEIDSAYSPITSVSVNVENVRVGKMTNWDKLILGVTTDGTIGVEEAFKSATAVLIEQFNALLGKVVEVKAEAVKEEVAVEGEEEIAVAEDEDSEDTDAKKKRGRPKKE